RNIEHLVSHPIQSKPEAKRSFGQRCEGGLCDRRSGGPRRRCRAGSLASATQIGPALPRKTGIGRIPPRNLRAVIYSEKRRGTSARPSTKVGKGQMDERDAKAKKQSLYFPQEMLEEIKGEAVRLE